MGLIDPARMRDRVTLQQRQSGQDAAGQPSQTWADVATVWADVRRLSGIEAIKAGADTATVRASVRVRWRSGVDAGMRLVIDGQAHDIEAVLPNKHDGYIDIACVSI